MSKDDFTGPGASLDWLTITGKDAHGDCELFEVICQWQDAFADTYKTQDWRLLGYRGRACGPVKMGFRGDENWIIQLSGETANYAIEKIPALAKMNVSRVDYQVTRQLPEITPAYIQCLHMELKELKRDNPSFPSLTLIQSDTGDTLYIGKRTSNRYIRIYDKGGEQGGERNRIIRYEVEYKKDKAQPAWETFVDALPNRTEHILGTVQAELSRIGLEVRFSSDQLATIKAEKTEPLAERQLAWLRRCVKPVTMKLVQEGYFHQVYEILMGSAFPYEDTDTHEFLLQEALENL